MRDAALLIRRIGSTSKTGEKLEALTDFFRSAPDPDKVWLLALFSGRRPKRPVNTTLLSNWCRELTGMPDWLFEECYHTVGDLAETIALLLPEPVSAQTSPSKNLSVYLERLLELESAAEAEKKEFIITTWQSLNKDERFLFNKLITGGFRIGISQSLMVQAIARYAGLDAPAVAHRITGNWHPATTSWEQLIGEQNEKDDQSKPYPFYLAYALESQPHELGDPERWQAEWKWDGIRGQLIKRNGEFFTWSRGEELMTEKFPEYHLFAGLIPNGTVLDGEILAMSEGQILPFSVLQTRIGRKNVSKKQLSEAPVGFIAYDLLEWQGQDFRQQPLSLRRSQLESLIQSVNHPSLRLSPTVSFGNWDELAEIRSRSRDENSEGIMLKALDSFYQVGRKRGDWWKWKVDAMTIDAVLVYAQKGHGRRSNLYTDYTFAVRDGERLVTFTKAYSGLTDAEFSEVDAFVRKNSLEKFGPVRTVKPELVFEIAFEGIAASSRHKSGIALRFPRMHRWRRDKSIADINTLDDLKGMLGSFHHNK